MVRSRRADAAVFGSDFQVNAAIVLFLNNAKDVKSLRLEGNYEDIEIGNRALANVLMYLHKTDYKSIKPYGY